MLSPDQIQELKEQLSEQIKHLPEQQRAEAQEQIDSMSAEALEALLTQERTRAQNQKIMRLIVQGEIPSRKIDENKDAVAVLEIKPISKGHMIIIPKKLTPEPATLPQSAFSLGKKLAKKIAKKLKAARVDLYTEKKFGEAIINVLPVYDKPLTLISPRYEASEKELEEVYGLLRVIKKPHIPRVKRSSAAPSQERIVLKRKIP